MRHLQLFFEIGEHSQPPQQHLGVALPGVVNGEPIVLVNINVVEVCYRSLNLLHALIGREHRHFVGIA